MPFRNPALLAKMAATADAVSGGRLILGLGAGWADAESDAFGYPTDDRVGRFEEALQTSSRSCAASPSRSRAAITPSATPSCVHHRSAGSPSSSPPAGRKWSA